MTLRHCLLVLVLAWTLPAPVALAQEGGTAADFGDTDTEGESDGEGDDEDGDDDGNDDIDDLAEHLNDGYQIYEDARDAWSEWESLDEREADCGSNYTADAGPSVPSQCGDSRECQQCFGDAVRAIDFNRFYIERARCITAANVRMANSAMAFGDTSSGVHGVTGLSWSLGGKPQIEQAVGDLKRTYTRKARDYLFEIERSMKKLGQCEAEHFGERDWYQRYGWLYVNFMRSKYGTAPE